MQRLVIYQDNLFNVYDRGRWFMLLDRDDVKSHATQAEIRDAIRQHEFAQYGLPAFDTETELYYWPSDPSDQYDAEEIGSDAILIGHPPETIEPLLELARLCAQFGIL
jgi:hypothetical protein